MRHMAQQRAEQAEGVAAAVGVGVGGRVYVYVYVYRAVLACVGGERPACKAGLQGAMLGRAGWQLGRPDARVVGRAQRGRRRHRGGLFPGL